MVELKIVKIGNSLGARLPREVLKRMHVADGDKLILTETLDDGYRISPYDPELERQMALAEEGIRRYRNIPYRLVSRMREMGVDATDPAAPANGAATGLRFRHRTASH